MAWNSKRYARINWKNRPSTATALGATNLNRMDAFLNEVDNALIEFDAGKLNIATANSMIASLTIDTGTGIVVATQLDGTVYTWDLNLEKIPVSFSLSEDGILTMTTDDGTEWTANISELIKDYVFDDSDTVGFAKEFSNNAYHVTAIVKDGSIEGKHLNPDYRADIQTYKNDAQAAASDSEQCSKDSKRWAVGDSAYAGSESDNSKFYSMQSKSYAVGTAGEVREGDAEDNSKYYYEQSKNIFDGLSAGQVTGVKGNEEEEFRKGNVNLTASNIGAIATNGDASLATVTFSQATALANVQSGDSMATALGKLSKLYAELEGGRMNYWSLSGGTEFIASGSYDLNDVKAIGNYYAYDSNAVNACANIPPVNNMSAFVLKVERSAGRGNYFRQILKPYNRNDIWIREFNQFNAWTDWKTLAPSIANDLTTTAEGSALDATQGKVLGDKIAELNGKIPKVLEATNTIDHICYSQAVGNISFYTYSIDTIPADYPKALMDAGAHYSPLMIVIKLVPSVTVILIYDVVNTSGTPVGIQGYYNGARLFWSDIF